MLSILFSNYNDAEHLPETLDSILAQEYQDFELLIMDDGSTDESCAILKSYAEKDPRLKPYFSDKNCGVHAQLNKLVGLAKGRYIQLFSSNDLFVPGFLSKCMTLFERHKDMKLCCTNIEYFNDKGTRRTHLYPSKEPRFFNKQEMIDIFRTSDFWITGVSAIYEKETFLKYGGHNPKLANLSDWYLVHNIALYEGVGYVPEVLIKMRDHASSVKTSRKAPYYEILKLIDQDRDLFKRFESSSLLSFIFENLFWKMLWRPKYWGFFAHIDVKGRIKRSLKKRLS